MEEIIKKLEEIINQQLELCTEKKEVPSSDVLDTIRAYSDLLCR